MHEIQFRISFKLYWLLQFGSWSKILQQFQLGTRTRTSQVKLYWKFQLKVWFAMSGFAYSSNSRLKQKRPTWNLTESSTRGSAKHFASKTLLKVKLYWFSLEHKNQTIFKLSSCSLCVLVLDIILKSLFISYAGKNHNPVSLLAWNCFMKIIVCVLVTNYRCIMGKCPE